MSELSTKIVKLDLEFILKHYLNRALWKKKWTIFKFDDYSITVNLYEISIQYNNIKLRVSLITKTGREIDFEILQLPLDKEHRNIKVLNQNLSGRVVTLIETLERNKIYQTEQYDRALEAEKQAKEAVEKAAEAFLDSLNITNEDVRDAYIRSQKSNLNLDYTYDVKMALRYKILTSFYLTYLRFAEYESRYQFILEQSGKADYDTSELDEFIDSLETGEFSDSLQLDNI